VELTITSNRSWMRKDEGDELNCWGLCLQVPAKLPGGFLIYPATNRIARWETVQVVNPHKPKKHQVKDVSKPVIIMRRAVVYTWAGKSLVLIEREKGVVEIIEASKVPESDDVVGCLVQESSILTLKADGTYEIQDAPPKNYANPAPLTNATPAQP